MAIPARDPETIVPNPFAFVRLAGAYVLASALLAAPLPGLAIAVINRSLKLGDRVALGLTVEAADGSRQTIPSTLRCGAARHTTITLARALPRALIGAAGW